MIGSVGELGHLSPNRGKRIDSLDALRGIAIVSVVLFHYTYRWGPLDPDKFDLYHFQNNTGAFALGWIGVELFFVVSGFVIFMTLERCLSWGDFTLRRISRLYPPYLLGMILTFLFTTLFGPPQFHSTISDLAAGLSMASPYLWHGWVDGVYWSLLVELKFYFWICLLYFAFRARFMIAWLGFCLITVALPLLPHIPGQSLLLGEYAPYFFAGMAYYLRFKREALDWQSGALLAFAIISYVELWHSKGVAVHALVLTIAALFELLLTDRLNWMRSLQLHRIGQVSYSLYLIHQFIGVTMIGWLNRISLLNGIPAVAIVVALMVATAFAMYHWVEEPSHRRMRQWAMARLRLRAFPS